MRVTDVAKRLLLGRPMATAQLEHERLGKPTALAVFASDNFSSSAYATEEILRVLVPAVGVAAFALVVPISMALLGVLAILLFSYRQTIKAYPDGGRRLHRHEGQLRAADRAGRGRRPPHRLRAHRIRVGGGRSPGAVLVRRGRCTTTGS